MNAALNLDARLGFDPRQARGTDCYAQKLFEKFFDQRIFNNLQVLPNHLVRAIKTDKPFIFL